MRLSFRNALLFFTVLSAGTSPLSAGPPFQTDDPEPVGYHHWEAYFASQITRSAERVSGAVPEIEVNYGLLPAVQVHLIAPLSFNAPVGDSGFVGPGDVEFGVKYRFIKEKGAMPQVGTFPHVEYPLGNYSRGLGAGHVQIFLPLWIQKSWGSWTTYGGGGYWFNLKNTVNNSWFFGWELQRDFSKMVTPGVEIFFNSATPEKEVGFNAGIILNLSKMNHLLASIGRDIIGKNKLAVYGAYQVTFGPD